LLAKELEIMKSMQEKNSVDYKQVENSNSQLDKRLKEKEWELADCKAMHASLSFIHEPIYFSLCLHNN
jgi:hypothetical protein